MKNFTRRGFFGLLAGAPLAAKAAEVVIAPPGLAIAPTAKQAAVLASDASHVLISGGRGIGKTRTAMRWVEQELRRGKTVTVFADTNVRFRWEREVDRGRGKLLFINPYADTLGYEFESIAVDSADSYTPLAKIVSSLRGPAPRSIFTAQAASLKMVAPWAIGPDHRALACGLRLRHFNLGGVGNPYDLRLVNIHASARERPEYGPSWTK